MNKNEYRNLINEALKTDERIWNEAKTELNETKLIDFVENIDENIIGLLLENDKLREKFFVKVKDVYVFKINDFRFFIEENKVENSFTKYKNQIGLTDGKRFLKDTNDIVLNWPYKDCILEGGQTKDDGLDTYFEFDEKEKNYEQKTAKRKEIFYNEVLAADEIDRLLDQKALVNWKRFTAKGEEKVTDLKRDENGTIKENLIIKGNNLLALHSIYKEFAGKVKLIYIDPPYNTGNDEFKYNDNFNHSTWLTFVFNRLKIAHKLLSNSGSIFISIDDREFSYLKLIADEIFGRDNFLNDLIWNSTKSVTNTALMSVSHNHTLIYFKNKKYFTENRTEFRLLEDGLGFENPDNDSRGPWKADPFQVGGWRKNQQYEIINPITGVVYKPNPDSSWKNDLTKYQELQKDNRIIFGVSGEAGPQRKRFLSEAIIRGKVAKSIWDDVGTTTNGTQQLQALNLKESFKNPKPEQFIERIINLASKEGDIVLDYHLGSGTTAAVAHKMGRQYIGIEQMDYIDTITVERMKKVIEGEQGGISKALDWKGGGDFVYFELAKWNITAKEKINNCARLEELILLFDEMYNNYFLNYNLKISEFKEKVIKEENFINLPFDEQKKMFIAMLDNNQMYVNYTEMDDSKFVISEFDKNLTNQFYSEK